jgi:hypothetical protein
MIGGCTTLHPIANVPSDLSQHFGDGGALRPGDRVIITTLAGARHELRVRSVHDGVIYGDHIVEADRCRRVSRLDSGRLPQR